MRGAGLPAQPAGGGPRTCLLPRRVDRRRRRARSRARTPAGGARAALGLRQRSRSWSSALPVRPGGPHPDAYPTLRRIGKLEAPLLVLHGDRDDIVRSRRARPCSRQGQDLSACTFRPASATTTSCRSKGPSPRGRSPTGHADFRGQLRIDRLLLLARRQACRRSLRVAASGGPRVPRPRRCQDDHLLIRVSARTPNARDSFGAVHSRMEVGAP
jgi:hypothetical protein